MSTPQAPPPRVVAAAQIQHVRLVESRCKTGVRVPEGRMVINYPVTATVKEHRPDGTFDVEVSIEARVTREKAPKRPLILVFASYQLTYKLPKAMPVSSGELEAFANTNAIFNAWPYMREFVQSMFGRMTLPVPTLPLYRLSSGPQQGGKRQVASGAKASIH